LVLLTPSALERCGEPGDWLRSEIEVALDSKRNIVPRLLPIDECHYEVCLVSTPLAGFDSHRLRMQRLPSTKCERRKIHGGNVEISKNEIPTFPPHDGEERSQNQNQRTKV
jgi:hypothetical protein